MLAKLLQRYAIRAREFSDAVAGLGKHEHGEDPPGSEFLSLLEEIHRRQALCNASGDDLRRYVATRRPGAVLPVSAQADEDLNEIRQDIAGARERYKKADDEFRALTAQARDVGLVHPDGVQATRKAGAVLKNINEALEQYRAGIGRLLDHYHRDSQ